MAIASCRSPVENVFCWQTRNQRDGGLGDGTDSGRGVYPIPNRVPAEWNPIHDDSNFIDSSVGKIANRDSQSGDIRTDDKSHRFRR